MSELERLRDRVDELEELLGVRGTIPRKMFRSCPLAAEQLIGMLLARPSITREAAYTALYGGRPEADQPMEKIIGTRMCQARKALTPHGIAVKTVWGSGYYMTGENKAKLRALLDEEKRIAA